MNAETKRKIIETLSDSQDGGPIKKLFNADGSVKEEQFDNIHSPDPLSMFIGKAIADAMAESDDVKEIIIELNDRLSYGVDQMRRAIGSLGSIRQWMDVEAEEEKLHKAEVRKMVGY